MADRLSVTCPCCGAELVVDGAAGVVVSHTPPARDPGERVDFERRLGELDEEKQRAQRRMEEAMRAEKDKGRLLADRFRELMRDADEEDDARPPVRDVDL